MHAFPEIAQRLIMQFHDMALPAGLEKRLPPRRAAPQFDRAQGGPRDGLQTTVYQAGVKIGRALRAKLGDQPGLDLPCQRRPGEDEQA
jgi:hypothetical protein